MPETTEKPSINKIHTSKEKPKTTAKGLTRRKFVILLGAGASASIAGYFLQKEGVITKQTTIPQSSGRPALPHLKSDVVFAADGDMATISLPDNPDAPLCAVNHTGSIVLRNLDGQHTIEEISKIVAAELNLERTEAMDAKIAYFVAQVSMLSFLREPFYACLFEQVEI